MGKLKDRIQKERPAGGLSKYKQKVNQRELDEAQYPPSSPTIETAPPLERVGKILKARVKRVFPQNRCAYLAHPGLNDTLLPFHILYAYGSVRLKEDDVIECEVVPGPNLKSLNRVIKVIAVNPPED